MLLYPLSENRIDKPKNGGSKEDAPVTASATEEDATITPATEEERFYKESSSNGSSGNKSGDSSDGTHLRVFLEDPPEWFHTQLACVSKKERQSAC
jgi:hypothetical protein